MRAHPAAQVQIFVFAGGYFPAYPVMLRIIYILSLLLRRGDWTSGDHATPRAIYIRPLLQFARALIISRWDFEGAEERIRGRSEIHRVPEFPILY